MADGNLPGSWSNSTPSGFVLGTPSMSGSTVSFTITRTQPGTASYETLTATVTRPDGSSTDAYASIAQAAGSQATASKSVSPATTVSKIVFQQGGSAVSTFTVPTTTPTSSPTTSPTATPTASPTATTTAQPTTTVTQTVTAQPSVTPTVTQTVTSASCTADSKCVVELGGDSTLGLGTPLILLVVLASAAVALLVKRG